MSLKILDLLKGQTSFFLDTALGLLLECIHLTPRQASKLEYQAACDGALASVIMGIGDDRWGALSLRST